MLSRIAESLFWIGRYIERADGTARILDVYLQLLLEDTFVDEDTACRALLGVMGNDAPPERTLRRGDVIRVGGCRFEVTRREYWPAKRRMGSLYSVYGPARIVLVGCKPDDYSRRTVVFARKVGRQAGSQIGGQIGG